MQSHPVDTTPPRPAPIRRSSSLLKPDIRRAITSSIKRRSDSGPLEVLDGDPQTPQYRRDPQLWAPDEAIVDRDLRKLFKDISSLPGIEIMDVAEQLVSLRAGEHQGMIYENSKELVKGGGNVVVKKGLVHVGLRVWDIWGINSVNESFFCKFRLFLEWFVDPELTKGCSKGDKLGPDTKGVQVPDIKVVNAISGGVSDTGSIKVVDPDTGLLEMTQKFECGLGEEFELQDFPFDAQDLSITIALSTGPDRKRMLVPSRQMEIEKGVTLSEWILYEGIQCDIDAIAAEKSALRYRVKLQRAHGYYTRSVMGTIGGITTLSLTQFAVDHQDWAGRAQVTLTILLTCVAFKFLILENLPKIPQITRLDYYINCCFAMVFVISISSSILAAQRDRISEDTAEVVDSVLCYASILLWVGFHVWFIWKTRSFIHLMKRAHRLTGGARHPGGLVVPADVESDAKILKELDALKEPELMRQNSAKKTSTARGFSRPSQLLGQLSYFPPDEDSVRGGGA